MRTANPNMFLFNKEDQARTFLSKQKSKSQLLKATQGGYFVEINITDKEETALECWPNHYTLLLEKL